MRKVCYQFQLGTVTVADSERVRRVRLNPLLRPNYFIFVEKFENLLVKV